MFDRLYWLLNPKKKREALAMMESLRASHDAMMLFYEREFVMAIAPDIGMPTMNIENWPAERLRWSVEHILSKCEERKNAAG